MSDFAELLAQWERIKAGEESYGEGEPGAQAREFYQKHLEGLGLERMRAQYIEDHPGVQIDTLVSMVGLSPATSITAACVLRPKRLVLIHTLGSKDGLNAIMKTLIGQTQLMAYDQITARLCEASDPVHIYEVIRSALAESRELTGSEQSHDAIDITGGKKVMSAASALVAWQLGLEICYTDSHFCRETKTPTPGSERFVHLGNPLTIFGEQEIQVATELFNGGNHTAAAEQFERLSQRIRTSDHARFCATLSRLYSDWCAFSFDLLEEHITRLSADLEAGRTTISVEQSVRLHKQFDYLRSLGDKNARIDPERLLVNFIVLADHYHTHQHRDFAAMLYYRAFEAAAQCRLLREHNIDAGAPDLASLTDEQRARFEEVAREVFNIEPDSPFICPPKFGFMMVMILLFALDHDTQAPIMKRATLGSIKDLKGLLSTSQVRNASILAHGHAPIPQKDLNALIFKSTRFVGLVWNEIYPEEPFERVCTDLRFLQL